MSTPLERLRHAVLVLPAEVPVTLTWADADALLAHIDALEAVVELERRPEVAPARPRLRLVVDNSGGAA